MARLLWLVEWLECYAERDWDVYSDFVVCCAREEEARDTHPATDAQFGDGWTRHGSYDDWIQRSETSALRVTSLGVAYSATPEGLVCVSYHGA